MSFDMRRAIALKRDGARLSAEDWNSIVSGHQDGSIDDAQLAALLMAIVLRGMDLAETAALTRAMLASGETLEAPLPNCVDKHSSGGVADSASLIVVPLAAACGIPVAKLSGRALGHTGGTLDKLEAIPGVTTALSPERYEAQVREIGCAIAAQSDRLVPADKRIYALRDRTSTVSSLGLVASSIVSKKIAGGAQAIVFDVKVGGGAFFARLEDARELAEMLVALAASFGRRAHALVTDMNEPLGPAIGTGLEIIEARDFLRGLRRDDRRLRALCEALAAAMLRAGGMDGDPMPTIERALIGGAAYERFGRMLSAQGAHHGALEKLAPHREKTELGAARAGYVTAIDATALGMAARALVERDGACAGIGVECRIGDRVEAGQPLATVYGDSSAEARIAAAFTIGETAPPPRPLVYFETTSERSTLAMR
jgi:pyrimidine-nucleoside phosphorylase